MAINSPNHDNVIKDCDKLSHRIMPSIKQARETSAIKKHRDDKLSAIIINNQMQQFFNTVQINTCNFAHNSTVISK